MTYKDQVEVDLHDDINEIVEETLEEASEPKGAGAGKEGQPIGEPESIASVDKASDATKKTSLPKTKAAMVNAMYIKASAMKREELATAYKAMMGENVEVQDELVAGNIDTTAELDALVESEATLSDEFKQKTAVIFEAAVKSKLSEEVSRLEEQYQEELAEEVQAIRSDLVEKIDSYMNYVVESWMEENRVAIHNGLRTEIAEGFIKNLKDRKKEIGENVEFVFDDIRNYEFENCSLVTSLFTLQFMPKKDRGNVIQKIYDGLNDGGGFIFSEKIDSENSRMQDMMTFNYYDYKRQKFKYDDIMSKEQTLRHMLKPNTWREIEEMIYSAGFKSVEQHWRNHNFVGAIAIK